MKLKLGRVAMGRVLHLGPSWHGPSFKWAELAWAELVLGRVVLHPCTTFNLSQVDGHRVWEIHAQMCANILTGSSVKQGYIGKQGLSEMLSCVSLQLFRWTLVQKAVIHLFSLSCLGHLHFTGLCFEISSNTPATF